MAQNRSRFVLLCQQSLALGAGGRRRGPGGRRREPRHRRPPAQRPSAGAPAVAGPRRRLRDLRRGRRRP